MDVFKYFGICFLLLPAIVTGIDFTFTKQRVLLGSEGTLTMTCNITETDVDRIYLLQIRRLKSATLLWSEPTNWTTLVFIEPGKTDSPSLYPGVIANTKDYVTGGSWDRNSPSDAFLTLSMNIQKIVCDDARYYRCEMAYKTSISKSAKSVKKNSIFSAYVKPKVTSLIAKKNGFIVQQSSTTDAASVNVGDELELTCTANIGSVPGTIISWHRTSENASTNEFIGYQPPEGTYDDGTAISDNQCGYTRVAIIKYNVTTADADRDNTIAFECYVTVNGGPYGNSYTSENNQRFYANVTYQGISVATIGTESNIYRAIISGVFGGIVTMISIVVLTCFLWSRRHGDKTNDPKKQVQQYQQRESRQADLSDWATTPNIYQQFQNRTEMESTVTYDTLQPGSSEGQSSQSHYENLNREQGNLMQECNRVDKTL